MRIHRQCKTCFHYRGNQVGSIRKACEEKKITCLVGEDHRKKEPCKQWMSKETELLELVGTFIQAGEAR